MRHDARFALWISLCALLAAPAQVSAFCGFYVGSSEAPLGNEGSTVILYREGDLTVLTMQNDYRGPRRDFALVVPVPTVIERSDVRVLSSEVFDRVDSLAAPRLVRYDEPDPCLRGGGDIDHLLSNALGGGGAFSASSGRGGSARAHVRVERRFEVGEYEIVVLGADDSGALEAWLHAHRYRIPAGVARHLRPYVESGSRFFVARVRAAELRGSEALRTLSPISVRYLSPQLELPIQLGKINSRGSQDLVVHVLARTRMELANRPNVRAPTNVVTTAATFSHEYAERLAAIWSEQPDAAITEYAWRAASCDPCPTPPLDGSTLAALRGPARGVSLRVTMASSAPAESWRLRMLAGRDSVQVRACLARHELRPGPRGRLLLRQGQRPYTRSQTAQGRAAGACLASLYANVVVEQPTLLDFQVVPARPPQVPDVVLTRLHLRVARSGRSDDLVFRTAPPLLGGRGEPGRRGELRDDVRVQSRVHGVNNFQTRWAYLVPFSGTVRCASPMPRWRIPDAASRGSRGAQPEAPPEPARLALAAPPSPWRWLPAWLRPS